jgi:hypothetical protein
MSNYKNAFGKSIKKSTSINEVTKKSFLAESSPNNNPKKVFGKIELNVACQGLLLE